MDEEHKNLIGELSDYRCPNCGCTLYVNGQGDSWCSNGCGYDAPGPLSEDGLIHLPPPDHIKEEHERMRAVLGEAFGIPEEKLL